VSLNYVLFNVFEFFSVSTLTRASPAVWCEKVAGWPEARMCGTVGWKRTKNRSDNLTKEVWARTKVGIMGWAPIRHCTLISTNHYTEILDKQRTKRVKKYSQTSRLEKPEELQLHHNHESSCFWICSCKIKIKILGSECQTSGTYATRAKQATKKYNAVACLCFLNYLALLRPAADRTISIFPWVVSRGRSYGFLWAVRLFKKCEEGQSYSGLFASNRSKTSHGAC
jgi:hypothetical protein